MMQLLVGFLIMYLPGLEWSKIGTIVEVFAVAFKGQNVFHSFKQQF